MMFPMVLMEGLSRPLKLKGAPVLLPASQCVCPHVEEEASPVKGWTMMSAHFRLAKDALESFVSFATIFWQASPRSLVAFCRVRAPPLTQEIPKAFSAAAQVATQPFRAVKELRSGSRRPG